LDLTKEDEDNGQGNIERTDGRGKGLIYKLPNKIAQDNRRNKVDYGLWTVQELKSLAAKMTDDIDTARMKCSKLQGVIDGVLKDRTMGLKDIIECLIDKVETQENTNLLQKERMEAIIENKRLKKEIGRLEQEKIQKLKEIEGIRSMYEEMEDKYIQLEKVREKEKKFWNTEDSGKEDGNKTKEILQETYALIEEERPVLRPPLKGISKILTTGSPRLAVSGAPVGTPVKTPRGQAPLMVDRMEVSPVTTATFPGTSRESIVELEKRKEGL